MTVEAKIYFRRDPKVDPLRIESGPSWRAFFWPMVPPGGPVFGPFILSDVLKLCKLLYVQNVNLEATLTQTASVAGILTGEARFCVSVFLDFFGSKDPSE